MLRFLVVGTFRCGTAYIAQVLNRMGIACGHGWVHTADGMRRYPEFEILGDASPMGAPAARDFDGLVLHQVRHPLEVIGSLVGSPTTRNALTRGPEGAYLARHFASKGDPVDDAMRYYVDWNVRCERHDGYLRYRIEDLDVKQLLKFADLIGRRVDEDTASQALATVPSDFNTRYGTRKMGWGDLPEGPSRVALRDLAARYGYPVVRATPRLAEVRESAMADAN